MAESVALGDVSTKWPNVLSMCWMSLAKNIDNEMIEYFKSLEYGVNIYE